MGPRPIGGRGDRFRARICAIYFVTNSIGVLAYPVHYPSYERRRRNLPSKRKVRGNLRPPPGTSRYPTTQRDPRPLERRRLPCAFVSARGIASLPLPFTSDRADRAD